MRKIKNSDYLNMIYEEIPVSVIIKSIVKHNIHKGRRI